MIYVLAHTTPHIGCLYVYMNEKAKNSLSFCVDIMQDELIFFLRGIEEAEVIMLFPPTELGGGEICIM